MANTQDAIKALRAIQEQRADRALADYRFGSKPDLADDQATVVDSEGWQVDTFDGKDDWTNVLHVAFADEPDAPPRKVSFHAAFYEGEPALMEAYAYLCSNGGEIGYSIQETFKARIVNGDFFALHNQPEVFLSLADAVEGAEEFLSDTNDAGLEYGHNDIEFVAESGRVLSLDQALDELALDGPCTFPGQVLEYDDGKIKGYCVAVSASRLMHDRSGQTVVLESQRDALSVFMNSLPADANPVTYQVTGAAGQAFAIAVPCSTVFSPKVITSILSANGAKPSSFAVTETKHKSQIQGDTFMLPLQADELIAASKILVAPVKKSPGMGM